MPQPTRHVLVVTAPAAAPAALRDPLLRGRGGRIFREHYRLLTGPL